MSEKSAFISGGKWYKGNTHAHTTLSDGRMIPQELANTYKSRGYSFLAITDHRRYGIHSELQSKNFLIFPGVELDVVIPGTFQAHHIIGISTPDKNKFAHGYNFVYNRTKLTGKAIAELLADGGNYCIYAHPTWSQIRFEEFDKVEPIIGMEIFNYTTYFGGNTGYADAYFDRLLYDNKRAFCFACDDTHSNGVADYGRGFIMVKAEELSHQSIMQAILKGSFYASTGPAIEEFYVQDGIAHLKTSPCKTHTFYATNLRGFAQHVAGATEFSYRLNGKEKFIRAFCEDNNGNKAWSQPIYL